MTKISLNFTKATAFTSEAEIEKYKKASIEANKCLHNKTGKGNDFLGWVNLPSSITEAEIADIENTAKLLASISDIIIVAGIGGSYLGSKAVLEACGTGFEMLNPVNGRPHIVFAGHHLDEDYHYELLKVIKGRRVSCIAISKSGTTTEPAVAFRIIKQFIEQEYGAEEARKRIVAITDKSRGALKQTATKEGYKTFIIPDDVGGRYSVLTPVGLLPIAAAGYNIREMIQGALDMEKATAADIAYENNIAAQYAVIRNCMYAKGKKIEILANFNPKLHFMTEWWKQLYGESEGKENKGIFPAGVDFTCDLHSMGQYVQEGERMLFETVISVKKPQSTMSVPSDKENLDGLNFLSGKRISEVNYMAELGTMLAHVDGGVPNIRIELPELNMYYTGQLMYFFEKACGISGYILDVNPFDQPGVEAYKKNMFALLGKPGYEKEGEDLRKRLKD